MDFLRNKHGCPSQVIPVTANNLGCKISDKTVKIATLPHKVNSHQLALKIIFLSIISYQNLMSTSIFLTLNMVDKNEKKNTF